MQWKQKKKKRKKRNTYKWEIQEKQSNIQNSVFNDSKQKGIQYFTKLSKISCIQSKKVQDINNTFKNPLIFLCEQVDFNLFLKVWYRFDVLDRGRQFIP